MKKWSYVVLALILLIPSCGPASVGEPISTCHKIMDGLSALPGMEFPANFQTENPVKIGGEFDVMQYFTVLDHLSMQPGYVLDYVYHFDGMGGYPVLYVRPIDQPPYATEADLTASGESTNYLDYVQADDTSEGYFQFVLLSMIADQFYLYWHAGYNDRQIVCDKADANDIVADVSSGDFGVPMPLSSRLRAALLTGVEPSVSVGKQTVAVRLVTFTNWGGFYLTTYSLNLSAPHTIQDMQEQNLVPYDCGIMF